ncbi:MAG TPA: hypothetical protein VGN57_06350 [Pirellulaceae bacterium]|jgi:hypothetical protein|nr:hypothetical protein [Pirellulaceae bacterium]
MIVACFRRVVMTGALSLAAFGVLSFAHAAEQDAWLSQGLPPLIEPAEGSAKEPAYAITSLRMERNHVDQEVLSGTVERKWLVRTLPESVKLVILPVHGGRYAHYVNVNVNGPQASDRIGGVVGGLLDWRGKIPGGARVYLEMTAASPVKEQPPVRLSAPYWFGTEKELAAATKKGDPPAIEDATNPSLETVSAPSEVALPKGTPVWLPTGERKSFGVVYEQSAAGEPVSVLTYLARSGGTFHPYVMKVDREKLELEASALEAAKSNDPAVAANFKKYDQRLSAGEAPKRLAAPPEKEIKEGTRLISFTLHGMEPFVAMGPAADGVAKLQSTKGGEPLEKRVQDLYLDPAPEQITPGTGLAGTPNRPQSEPSKAPDPQAVALEYKIQKGDKFAAKWAGQFYPVEIVSVEPDGKVKIHWIGYTDAWDQIIPRTELFRIDQKPPGVE